VHHFGPVGLANGLVIFADKETGTLWDHFTGEAFDGPLSGEQLEVWPVTMTTVRAALAKHPDLLFFASPFRSFRKWLAIHLYPRFIHGRVWLPPPFLMTMSSDVDPRLDRLTQGLGVVAGREARFYPISSLPAAGVDEEFAGRILQVQRGDLDGVPHATWQDGGEAPMQLLTRWYGFAFSYPGCGVFQHP